MAYEDLEIIQNLQQLKIDTMAEWIQDYWIRQRPKQDWILLSINDRCMNVQTLEKFKSDIVLVGGYCYSESWEMPESTLPVVYGCYVSEKLTTRTGTFVYAFTHKDGSRLEMLVMSAYFTDSRYIVSLAAIPKSFLPTWGDFARVCQQLSWHTDEVTIIGGNQSGFTPVVEWDEIILPQDLKQAIYDDVMAFFDRGVNVYRRLKINPFRKILLAGPPGTGKTMLCNSLAKLALQRHYQVIYISGADVHGSDFYKMQQALEMAAKGGKPAIILLEELDAFLHDQQKSLILNVLDGVESFDNPKGTLLIATTNYPEAIDERVLKRPGRLDRIYIIPPVKDPVIAEAILKRYLGEFWLEEHQDLVGRIIGYPGAFIREVVVFAMTQVIDAEEPVVSLALLEDSLEKLKTQIDTRDVFMAQNANRHTMTEFGFAGYSES